MKRYGRQSSFTPLSCGASVFVAAALLSSPANAQADALYLRVVDVGAGLCVVAVAPGDHAMVYDAGRGVDACLKAVEELVPSKKIDLFVLSHSDGDHIGAAEAILAQNDIKTIIHPGDTRTEDLSALRTAIVTEPMADIWNMATRPVPIGTQFPLGPANVSFIAGWSDGNQTRSHGEKKKLDDAMRKNALSLVVRLEFAGHSILITGDTVGRYQYAAGTACEYAEHILVDNDIKLPLKSDVLIGQHHGADNATSNCFIRKVEPQYVIFSAGNLYGHPRQSTADRLVANGVSPDKILRTDRGGFEKPKSKKSAQWIYGTFAGCRDTAGDDDIEVQLPADPAVPPRVKYLRPKDACEQ